MEQDARVALIRQPVATRRIEEGGLDDARVAALLSAHVTQARAQTARGSAHALDLDALKHPAIRFWTLWQDDAPVAVAALRKLDATHGEVKSMHTAAPARGSGAGSAILAHLIAEAKAAGLLRLSLETGSWDYFAPARAFYRRHGFADCEPFAEYRADPNSVFMTRML
ncbi:MAG: GNAT family N-acetyltransferase [Rudaea sp.]|uniref:GNAT family N-acetyltransferase n=1 Tax=Rudaea sp. TaxID=2136325 RepID=UPI0039E58269